MTDRAVRDAIRQRIADQAHAVCHLTYCESLPDIAASGGLLSVRRRNAAPAHSWGVNEAAACDYVCLSVMCSWGMLRHQARGREVAMVLVDLLAIPDLSGTRFVPYNSASHAATPYIFDPPEPQDALAECLADRDSRKRSEVLVRGGVPISSVYGIEFCDQQAMDRWWPMFEASLPEGLTPPKRRLASSGRWFVLPPDFEATDRSAQPRLGVDQLHLEAPHETWISPRHWMDDDEEYEEALKAARSLREDAIVSWSDFYDDGEPDDADWYEPSVRD